MSEINYKFILIGNSGVGKGSFLRKLSTGEIKEKNVSTIGIDKKTILLTLDIINKEGIKKKQKFNISLFDTAGQEKFRSITKNYYKGSDGIFLLYDITEKSSFESVENWIESIKDSLDYNNEEKYGIVLIGNKLDLIEEGILERQVTEDEAKLMCEKYDMIWGGEQSLKNLDFEDFINLIGEYTGEIYKIIGDNEHKYRQRLKKISKFKKKQKKRVFRQFLYHWKILINLDLNIYSLKL